MATVGDRLMTVEAGWKRWENTAVNIGLLGSWESTSGTNVTNSSAWYIPSAATEELIKQSYVAFAFTNSTRIRILLALHKLYSKDLLLTLDGVEYHISCCKESVTGNVEGGNIAFEKLDLDPTKKHRLIIRAFDDFTSATGRWAIDAIDTDADVVLLPCMGQYLTSMATATRDNMNRYIWRNEHFTRTGTWTDTGANYTSTTAGDSIEWYAYCSEIHIFGYRYNNRSLYNEFYVDDEYIDTYSSWANVTTSGLWMFYDWYANDGTKRIHKFKIINRPQGTSRTCISFAGIDTDGYMCNKEGTKIDTTTTQGSIKGSATDPWGITASSTYSGYYTYLISNTIVQTSVAKNHSWYSANGYKTNQWVVYNCKEPFACNSTSISNYSITAATNQYCPKSFRIEGSDDNVNWTTIIEVLDKTDWDIQNPNHFDFGKTVNYQYYRLYLIETNGANFFGIGSWRLYITENADRYLLKTDDGIKTIDKVNKQLADSSLDQLSNSMMLSNAIPMPEDLLSVKDILPTNYKLISNKPKKVSVSGDINNVGVAVFNNDYYVSAAGNILKLKATYDMPEGCSVKFVVSTDSGVVWKTYDGTEWTVVSGINNSNITKGSAIILQNGIDITTIETVDFNKLNTSKMLFAFALSRDTVDKQVTISNITWDYDEVNRIKLLGPPNVEIEIALNTLLIAPANNYDKLYVNISTNI